MTIKELSMIGSIYPKGLHAIQMFPEDEEPTLVRVIFNSNQ